MHLIDCLKKEKKRNVEQTKDTSPHIIYIYIYIYIYKHTGMTYCLGHKHAHYAKITRLF